MARTALPTVNADANKLLSLRGRDVTRRRRSRQGGAPRITGGKIVSRFTPSPAATGAHAMSVTSTLGALSCWPAVVRSACRSVRFRFLSVCLCVCVCVYLCVARRGIQTGRRFSVTRSRLHRYRSKTTPDDSHRLSGVFRDVPRILAKNAHRITTNHHFSSLPSAYNSRPRVESLFYSVRVCVRRS